MKRTDEIKKLAEACRNVGVASLLFSVSAQRANENIKKFFDEYKKHNKTVNDRL